MPLYRVTIKRSMTTNGIRLEQGMSVDVTTPTTTNPVSVNGGVLVKEAFARIYGTDLSPIWLSAKTAMEVVKIN
ncbi:DUF6140 family protein [Capnocytophaga canimorsus]|nr:DUF6140 family protein [Capnocytophaga canimorsus]WGU67565.1 DUF6140 family protein [Capnocytophaga canimorsus]WGU71312.1 DUF6140 family protein [Capnocytophaga canimorsus]